MLSRATLFVACAILLTNSPPVSGQESGPPGDVILREVRDCDPKLNTIDFKTKLYKNEDDVSAMDMQMNLTFDIDKDVTVRSAINKWVNNDWQHIYENEGSLIEYLNKYLKTIYTRYRNEVVPEITSEDHVPAGFYAIKDFVVKSEDIDTPQVLYDKLKVFVTFLKNDKAFLCMVVQAEFLRPVLPS